MKLRRIVSRLIRIAAIIVVALLVLMGTALAVLQTGTAKRLVARKLTELLGEKLGPGSAVSEISGFIPFTIRVGDIRLCDRRGEWLRIERFSFRFSPSRLFRLRVRIDEVSADRVDVKRFPGSEAGTPEKKEGGGGLPGWLPKLELTRLSIRELILGKELAGERTLLTLDGNMNFNPGSESRAALTITGTESPVFSAALEGRANGDLERLDLKIGVSEEEGGILSRMLGLPEAGPISLRIQGEGPADRFRMDLEADVKKVGSIRGLLDLDIRAPAAEGEITVTLETLDSLSHLTKDPLSGSLRGSIRLGREKGIQNGSLQAKITDLAAGPVTAAETEISLILKDIVHSPSGELSLSLTGLSYAAQNEDGAAGAKTAALHVLCSGPPDDPRADLTLRVEGITFPSFPLDNPAPLAFSLDADLKDDRLGARADLSGRTDVQLRGTASGPAKLTLSPFSFALPSDGEIAGKLTARIDLGLLKSLEALSRQSLTGILSADFSAAGTVREPDYRGRLTLENGEYQNLDSGTVLTNLRVDVEMDRSGVVVRQFEAISPSGGKLVIDGDITLSPEKKYPFSSSLTLLSMEVANTDEYWAAVSGKIVVSGNTEAMDVAGDIDIDRAGFRIPKSSPPSVAGIPVIEINKPGTPGAAPAPPSPLSNNINLDLTIKATDQISVSGRGLSSTWGADLSIGGTAAAPVIKGGLQLSSGYFLFLGKRLDLANCSISLAGGIPLTPQIDINAQAVSGGILINLQIVGSPESPKLILTSQPPYPPDEILARLLFGAGKASLTAMEGARVAYGLQVLQGGNDVFDYLTGWTSFLGGPQLDLTQYADNPNATAVSARWELSDDISVENQQSLAGSGNLVIFYLDLTRRIQLMSIAGISGAGDGARARWHYDY